jgi:hypothetical protein
MSVAQKKYLEFANVLEQLRSDINHSLLDALVLQQRRDIIQQFYQVHIIPLFEENTDSNLSLQPEDAVSTGRQGGIASQILSINTEISKQLRLLDVDILFFKAAKQPATIAQRLDVLTNRLGTLIQYCQAIIQLYDGG